MVNAAGVRSARPQEHPYESAYAAFNMSRGSSPNFAGDNASGAQLIARDPLHAIIRARFGGDSLIPLMA